MKTTYLYIVLLTVFSSTLLAQPRGERKGGKEYDKLAYINAIKTYERIAEKGYKTPATLSKLADSYYFNSDYVNAEKWYTELFALTDDLGTEYYFRYAQSLKSVQNYEKADQIMARFNQKYADDSRGKIAKDKKDYREIIKKNSGRYNIENAGINSEYADYGSSFFGEKVVFASARDTGNFAKRKHTWTGQYFTRLYSADMSEDGSLSAPEKFANELRTRVHESSTVFSKDGKNIYFTRNNYVAGKKGKDAERNTLIKIYRSKLDDNGKWGKEEELPFNSNDYWVGHPALSPDGKTLYFASNMEGTLGSSDIFKVSINDDGTFGPPVNLGPKVNTEGRETFPFISDNNELYFSSDGHPGLGGLDIFGAIIQEDGSVKEVVNLGEPANTSYDDFAYIINSGTKRGFLSSNRPNGVGDDDIYKFLETRELQFSCEQILKGIVTDAETGEILANTKLTLMDDKFEKLRETTSDAEGLYDFGEVDCDTKYYVRAEKDEYNTKEVSVTTGKETGETVLPIALDRSEIPIGIGGDLADIFKINYIYFDLDKSNIRSDAAIDIAKVLDVLNEYPDMHIDIRSHTDCRHSKDYNFRLSDRRAKSTMEWLVKNKINKSRLTAKGYGESQLVNDCACECDQPIEKIGLKKFRECEDAQVKDCSEEQHQLNRRSQFIITKL